MSLDLRYDALLSRPNTWRYRLLPELGIDVVVRLTESSSDIYVSLIDPHIYRRTGTAWIVERMHLHEFIPDDFLMLLEAPVGFTGYSDPI